MSIVTVRRVENVMRPAGIVKVERKPWTAGKRVTAYTGPVTEHDLVILNGRAVTARELVTTAPKAGDEIVVATLPGITPAIAVGIAAAFGSTIVATSTAAAVLAFTLNFIIGAVVNIAIGFAISALSPGPSKVRSRALSDPRQDDPVAKTFGAQLNTIGAGVPIPIVYGRVRVFPHIVESFQVPRFDTQDTSEFATVTTIPADNKSEQDVVSLHTRAAIGHGPIQSVTMVELDDNPIDLVAGTQWEATLGTTVDKPLEGFAESKLARTIQQSVTFASAVSVQTASEIESFEVGLLFTGGLFSIDSAGHIDDQTVVVQIEFRKAGIGSYTVHSTETITAATRSPKAYWVRGPKLSRRLYDVRVTRTTADTSSSTIQDTFRFETLNEVVGMDGSTHPGVAEIGIRNLPGEQSRIWRRVSCLVEGLSKIRVYSDANTYAQNWTNSPAWCCADWITSRQYGPGKWFTYDQNIDIPSFIEWSEYAAELIPDGGGNFVPRAVFNMSIDSRLSGADILALFGQGSSTAVVQVGGRWHAIIDKAHPMTQVFSESNIVPGSLIYSKVPKTERATRFSATFVNEDENYRRDTLTIEDDTIAPSDGHVDTTVTMQGVTAPAQVAQVLGLKLRQNKFSTKHIEFETGVEALATTVGSVFGVCDPAIANAIATGQILTVASDERSFTLDDELVLDPAKTYHVIIVHHHDARVEQRLLISITADITETLYVGNSWDYTLRAGDRYCVLDSSVELFRCVEVGVGPKLEIKVKGVLYDDQIYDALDARVLSTRTVRIDRTTKFPSAVPNLTLAFRQPAGTVNDPDSNATNVSVTGNTIDVDWGIPEAGIVDHYEVWIRRTGSTWRRAGSTAGRHFEISENVANGVTYDVAVATVSEQGGVQSLRDASIAVITTT